MPASSAESCDPIEHLLQSSLDDKRSEVNPSSSFEQQLLNSAKKVLLSKVEFQPAENEFSLTLNNLKAKYIFLNPDGGGCSSTSASKKASVDGDGGNGRCSVSPQLDNDGIPMPKVVIHPPNKVTLGWQRIYRIGAGLINLGNTCFLNAILQCLTYTPPLVNHLIEFDEHATVCKNIGFCMMCELCRHIRRALGKNGETIKPQCILQKLKAIAKHMVWGRQEDAHEFLRYVMESMIKSSLKGYSPTSLDRISLETTVINHIFGGYHRSQVTCLRCKEKSDTYDHFMDIILDIKNVPSLEKAMDKFVQPEILDNENAYFCPRCKRKCPAQKKFSVHRTPNISTFQFKRFDYNRMVGGKITKQISFPEKFDMRPFMSQRHGPPIMFQLYAVLVHQGVSCNSGHYFCFVRNSNNLWYIMDDCKVRQVSLNFVLSQQAYLLFYTRVFNSSTPSFSKQKPEPQISLNSSPSMNGTLTAKKPNVNGTVPVKLKPTVTPLKNPVSVKTSTANNFFPLPNNRERVSFGLKTPLQQPFAQMNGQKNGKPNGNADQKHPRIVMQIKHGKVTSVEQPWTLSKEDYNLAVKNEMMSVPGNDQSVSPIKTLVPYIPDSSEESDQENHFKPRSSPMRSSTTVLSGESSSHPPEKSITCSSSCAKKCSPEASPSNGLPHLQPNLMEVAEQNAGIDQTKPLAVVTNSVKAKATSSWLVMDSNQQSPSVASEGSNVSVNSTTAWTVTPKQERQCPGWTVTEHDCNKTKLPKKKYYCNDDSQLHNHVEKCRKGPVYHSDTETHKPLRKRKTVSAKAFDDLRKAKNKCQSNISLPRETHPAKAPCSYAKTNGTAEVSSHQPSINNIPFSSCERLSSDRPNISSETPKNCKVNNEVEMNTETVNGSRTESLSKKHRKRKKHRKEKPNTDDEKKSNEVDSGSSDDNTFRSKKRKKKHKRHHDNVERPRDRHLSDSSSGFELEWVERTKESLEQERIKSNPVVKNWDEDVKDGYRLNQPGSNSSTNKKAGWDGKRFSNTAIELSNHTIHGYGSKVSTWDGERTQVDRELDNDFKKNFSRRYSDEYNKDYDRGRMKKRRFNNKQHYFDSGAGYNPFQWAQDKHCSEGRFQDRSYPKFSSSMHRRGNHYNNNNFNSRYEQFNYQHKL